MIVNSAQYTLAFSGLNLDDLHVRRQVEDAFSSYRFTLCALHGAPLEVPRMVGVTRHGHAQIQISNGRVNMRVLFDSAYQNDLLRCFDYVTDKIKEIEATIRQYAPALGESGIMVRYNFQEYDAIRQMQDQIFSWQIQGKLYDIGARFCIVKDKKYFVNIYLDPIHVSVENPFAGKVSVMVDINDRYAEKIMKQPMSQQTNVEILALHRMIAEKKLLPLLQEGRFDDDDE